ncbi:MAG TPA: acylphosphatase [Ilumatobacteraceae bacterium]|nr:acylphosphatase [Ilumatobacteraceae bacterium]
MIRVRAVVEGRVQGVWYRESCRREADSEGIAGWVRNNEDGSVEAVLEGEPHAVARVLAWMRNGPPAAIVTNVRVTEEEPRNEHGFKVR